MLHREVNDFSFENRTKPATHWVSKVQDWYLLMDEDMPDFGRVFLMLNYTDITQNTYVQS